MSEMQTAAETLQEIGWGVSIFGSARITPDSPYYEISEALGRRLAQAGLPVIAGGGPGIMEAANKGAFNAGGKSIGLNIKLAHEKKPNLYQTHSLHFEYFVSRKATFFMHSAAYIALPGGFGTLDELFEVLTLIQTRKIPQVPVVLVGTQFWAGMIDWVKEQLLPARLIDGDSMDMLTVTDDVDLIMRQIQAFCAEYSEQLGDTAILPE
ncbi:MAG TPA: TIGR00730 family Rossman fold protein [Eoetvoesiella sp.]|uniref:LOG family protein n=1 Tax=Eoetvoesiella sp. TaxID=1966355 RepID=UPI002CBC18A4|nr:TIGR00730 family Rossman fold protein [Eoetvoesiella sp.]HWK63018.1 TIGR00730 family Rossman fold protein [Eoetvoesiella sp.]